MKDGDEVRKEGDGRKVIKEERKEGRKVMKEGRKKGKEMR